MKQLVRAVQCAADVRPMFKLFSRTALKAPGLSMVKLQVCFELVRAAKSARESERVLQNLYFFSLVAACILTVPQFVSQAKSG